MADRDWKQDTADLRVFCAGIKRKVATNEPLKESEQMYIHFLLDASVDVRHRQDFFGSSWRLP